MQQQTQAAAQTFDVVVWGATGFTGQIVVEYLYQKYGDGQQGLKWAIAGRDSDRLTRVKETIGCDEVPVLVADSHDPASMVEMVEKTSVVLSTVGPYALYGSQLVAACAESGTHYCDLTGEVQWMRLMIEAHHDQAVASGARIVHTCGFDSIPSDLGVLFLQTQMQLAHGVYAESVKYRLVKAAGAVSGGTIASMLNMMDEASKNPGLLNVLADPYALNPINTVSGVDQNETSTPVYDETLQQWVGPFVMAGINTRVVRRSHALAGMPYGMGFGYEEGTLIGEGPKGYLKALLAGISTTIGTSLAAIDPMRTLLSRWLPKPGEGPAREKRESGFFEVILHGTAGQDGNGGSIKVKVTGDRDPGYGSTAKMIAEAAVCLAQDPLTSQGGVLTPSVAMGEALTQRLISNAGLSFEVID
ncbi:MAG: saccharopine dehydrogenase family protein [Pseudomonadales bacterium]